MQLLAPLCELLYPMQRLHDVLKPHIACRFDTSRRGRLRIINHYQARLQFVDRTLAMKPWLQQGFTERIKIILPWDIWLSFEFASQQSMQHRVPHSTSKHPAYSHTCTTLPPTFPTRPFLRSFY